MGNRNGSVCLIIACRTGADGRAQVGGSVCLIAAYRTGVGGSVCLIKACRTGMDGRAQVGGSVCLIIACRTGVGGSVCLIVACRTGADGRAQVATALGLQPWKPWFRSRSRHHCEYELLTFIYILAPTTSTSLRVENPLNRMAKCPSETLKKLSSPYRNSGRVSEGEVATTK